MSYFTYCSAIWHNSNESEKQKQERLNVRALRCVYNRWVPLHGDNHGLTLSSRCLQDIAILVFKAVNGMLPGYISDLFAVRNNVKCLRGPDTAEIRFFVVTVTGQWSSPSACLPSILPWTDRRK